MEPISRPQQVKAAASSTHLRLYPELLRPGSSSRLSIYASSRRVEISPGVRREAFGWYTPGQDGSLKSALTLGQLQNASENGWKWLLQEADAEGGSSASWDAATFPAKPVHGDARHRLLADGSVISLSLEASNLN